MKKTVGITLIFVFAVMVNVFAQTFSPALTETKPEAKPAVRAVAITLSVLEVYTAAQTRTAEARKAVEESLAWQKLVTMQSQEQTALIYVMAETGIKPSDECKPVMNKEGKLERFDCPIEKPKAKP